MGAAVRIRMDGIISSLFPSVFQTTKLKIKTGLVLLQKESRYAPSCGEICFCMCQVCGNFGAHRISAKKACNGSQSSRLERPGRFCSEEAEQAAIRRMQLVDISRFVMIKRETVWERPYETIAADLCWLH